MTGSSYLARFESWIMRYVLRAVGNPPIAITLPDGTQADGSDQGTCRLRFLTHGALFKLALDPFYQFPEAYVTGEIEIEGLEEMLAVVHQHRQQVKQSALSRISNWLHLPHLNTLARSRRNIHRHYDLGNDFYRLWLDRQMVYTCAYFAEPSYSLDRAQVAKLDYVCRKLCLKPDMQVIEAGCGWGALALHMAHAYGARVRAFNISHEQIAYARDQAQRLGLQDRVEFVEDDWRNISGPCDAFVSVGMLEHVGVKNYPRLGQIVKDCLRPTGLALIHSIGQNFPLPLNPWIERRIFPGAYPPSLREISEIFEPIGFSVLDVENLRLHYAQTLQHWWERFEASVGTIQDQFGERFVRAWRMYLVSSMSAFQHGNLQLFQIVFAHPSNNHIHRTRGHLYQPEKFRLQPSADSGELAAQELCLDPEVTYDAAKQ